MRLLMFLLLVSTNCFAAADQVLIKNTIMYIQPLLDEDKADVIANAVVKYSDKYSLDWRIMVSIMAQESSLQQDPQSCLKHHLNCVDLGIGQINWHTWGKALSLDKKRLVTDLEYNISVIARILGSLQMDYGDDEKHWYTRYHSFTKNFRADYKEKLYIRFVKIDSYAKGLYDGLLARE